MSDRVTGIQMHSEGIVIITIERPKALNALNRQVFEELHSFFTEGYKDFSGLSAVILTGSGKKAFVAGADIKELNELSLDSAREHIRFGHQVMDMIESFHVPVIAAINGFALGGGLELAMACHLRYASANARFGLPELKLGLIPGYGGTQRLIRYIGRTKAMELMLTSEFMNANTAVTYGLVNQVVDHDLLDHCVAIAIKLKNQGPLAISKAIAVMNLFGQESMEAEQDAFVELITSPEAKEGIGAFIEKRKALFKRP